MSRTLTVLSPPGEPALDLNELLGRPLVSALFDVPAGELESFVHNPLVSAYLDAGAYVVVDFEHESDAVELERQLAAARGQIQ